jgi:hypothetical protein
MPAHHAAMKEDFIREYTAAAEKFSQVLGKKQTIEGLIQERLDLPMPAPIAANLEDLAAPDTRLREAAEAITLADTHLLMIFRGFLSSSSTTVAGSTNCGKISPTRLYLACQPEA